MDTIKHTNTGPSFPVLLELTTDTDDGKPSDAGSRERQRKLGTTTTSYRAAEVTIDRAEMTDRMAACGPRCDVFIR